MLLYVSAEMQQLVARRTELYTDLLIPELLDQCGMLEQGESVSHALRIQEHAFVQIAVYGVARPSAIQERFSGVEHEGNSDAELPARLHHGEKLVAVIPNVVRPILCTDEIEAADEIGERLLELDAVLDLSLHHFSWDGARRAVNNLQAEREPVQLAISSQFILILSNLVQNETHLSIVVEFPLAVITRNSLVHEHGS